MKKQKNFAAFYAISAKMPGMMENKDKVIQQYTNGRTSSLKDMTVAEYNAMITDLKGESPELEERRKLRSAALRMMQKIGIDTTSWNKVDEFCLNSRIAGKAFRMLTTNELISVRKKCEAIRQKDKAKDLDEALERAYRYTVKNKQLIN